MPTDDVGADFWIGSWLCKNAAPKTESGARLIAPGSRRGETLRPEIYVCIATINRPGPTMLMM